MERHFDIEKLKGSENYHTWSFAVKNVMELKECGKCIESANAETDVKKLSASKALLSLSVEKHIYVHIRSCTSAFDIWTTLQHLYEDKGLSRKIGLLRTLMSARLDDAENMQNYVDVVVSHENKLQGIGFELPDEWLAAILLAGLTESYKPFIMGIEAANTELKSDKIISKLLDSQTAEGAKGDALFSKQRSIIPNNDQKKLKCKYCKKKGHTIDVCRKRKADNGESSSHSAAKANTAFIAHVSTKSNVTTQRSFATRNGNIDKNYWYVCRFGRKQSYDSIC